MYRVIKLIVSGSLFAICSCSSNNGDVAAPTPVNVAGDAAAERAASADQELPMNSDRIAEDGNEDVELLESGEPSEEEQDGLASAVDGPLLDGAKQLFERYVALAAAFDPAAADLYADDAKIENTRIYPSGSRRAMAMPAPAYRQLVRQAMPLAKARGDTNTYSNITFVREGDKIRVFADRFSNLKEYTSPLSLLVGPNKEGVWLIYEELSESRP